MNMMQIMRFVIRTFVLMMWFEFKKEGDIADLVFTDEHGEFEAAWIYESRDEQVPVGTVIMSTLFLSTRVFTIREIKAILMHEIGHAVNGLSEVDADIYVIQHGYGDALSMALKKAYALFDDEEDMDEWDWEYRSSPNIRMACLIS